MDLTGDTKSVQISRTCQSEFHKESLMYIVMSVLIALCISLHYFRGNIQGQQPYLAGDACTQCPEGMESCVLNSCCKLHSTSSANKINIDE